jgi:hypothetical protein
MLRRWRVPAVAPALGVLAGFYAWLAFSYLPAGVYWTPDTGLKRIQAANVRFGPALDLSIDYPGQALDPGFRFLPFRDNFYFVWQGRVRFSQPPVIAVLSAPLMTTFGDRAQPVVALLAGLFGAWLVARLAALTDAGPAWGALLLFGLATPWMVYSALLWEHTLAVTLGLGALAILVAREHDLGVRAAALSGALAGLAGACRKEVLLFAPLLFVYLATRRQGARGRAIAAWAAACSAPVLAWWSYAFVSSGNPVPPEFRISTSPALSALAYLLRVGPGALADFVFDPRYRESGDLLLLAAAGYGLANLIRPRASGRPSLLAAEAIQVLALAGLLVGVWRNAAEPVMSASAYGLWTVSPFLVLGWSEPGAGRGLRALRLMALGYFGLTTLATGLLTAGGPLLTGLEWGTRYSLLTFALWLPPALFGLRAVWRRARVPGNWLARVHLALAALLVAWSAAWLMTGLSLMRRPAVDAAARDALLGLSDSVVLTNLWWLSAAAPDLYLSRPMFLVDGEPALQTWLTAARGRGVRGFAFVSYVPLSASTLEGLSPPGVRLRVAETLSLPNRMLVTRVDWIDQPP